MQACQVAILSRGGSGIIYDGARLDVVSTFFRPSSPSSAGYFAPEVQSALLVAQVKDQKSQAVDAKWNITRVPKRQARIYFLITFVSVGQMV